MKTRSVLMAAVLAAVVTPIRADEPAAKGRKVAPGDLAARVKTLLGSADRPFTLLVTVKVKPGTERQFERAARKAVAATQGEKGCLSYECDRNLEEHGEYTFVERWRNVAALQAHLRESHTRAVLAAMREAAARAPRVRVLAPVEGGRPGGDRLEDATPGGKGRTGSRPPARE